MLSFRKAAAVLCLALTLLSAPDNSRAASADGGMPGSFLLNPAGARGAAMGRSFSAVADDASAVYWNPAAIAAASKPEAGLSRTWLFEGTDSSFLSFSHPFDYRLAGRADRAGVAAAYIRQASSGYEKRVNPFDQATSFSITNEAFLAGMGAASTAWGLPFSAGFTLKSVRSAMYEYSASGFGADAGVRAAPVKGLTLSAVLNNAVQPKLKLVSREVRYPAGLDLAAAYAARLSQDLSGILSAGALKYERASVKPSAGLEVSFRKTAALRLGLDGNGTSGGVGLKSGNYTVDYAVLFHELAPVHTFALSVRFGITMAELEEYIKRGISRFDREEAARLVSAYIQKAGIYLMDKDYVQAIKTLETAALWDPSNKEVSERLTRTRAEMDKTLNRQMIERNSLLAAHYYDKGDYVSSREYWQNVLDMDPADSLAGDYLKKIENRLSEKERENLQREKEATGRIKASVLLDDASALLKDGKYAAAAEKAKKALSFMPASLEADSLIRLAANSLAVSIRNRLEKVSRLCEDKFYGEALGLINSILRDDPGQKEALEKARLCRGALETDLSPDNKKKLDKLYYMAVDAYLKNDLEKAGSYLGEIFSMDPMNETAGSLKEKISRLSRKD